MRVIDYLDEIEHKLNQLNQRMERIEGALLGKFQPDFTIEETELIKLPDHLRKSYMAVLKLGNASATQISGFTKRSRAIESTYLNHLADMNKLSRRMEGKTVVFFKDGFEK